MNTYQRKNKRAQDRKQILIGVYMTVMLLTSFAVMTYMGYLLGVSTCVEILS